MEVSEAQDGKWATASLRIFSGRITDREIGDVLEVKATHTHAKGDRISPHHTAVRREWAWFLRSPLGKDRSVTEHLKWILDAIEPRSDALKTLFGECRIDLFCGLASLHGQGGFTLDPVTLRRLANLSVNLGLDLYPPNPVEAEDVETLN
jgi:hypothetical protein